MRTSKIISLLVISSLMLITAQATAASNHKDKVVEGKLLQLGFIQSEIDQLSPFVKENIVKKIFDKSKGKAKLITSPQGKKMISNMNSTNEFYSETESRSYSLSGVPEDPYTRDPSIFGFVEEGNSDSQYKRFTLTYVGTDTSPKNAFSEAALGIAWSDNWNIESHDGDTSYVTNPWWKSDNDSHTGQLDLINATPETGVLYGYDYPSDTIECFHAVEVKIRKDKNETGTTDVVTKFAISEENVKISGTVSWPPAVTFTPSEKLTQIATTEIFDY